MARKSAAGSGTIRKKDRDPPREAVYLLGGAVHSRTRPRHRKAGAAEHHRQDAEGGRPKAQGRHDGH